VDLRLGERAVLHIVAKRSIGEVGEMWSRTTRFHRLARGFNSRHLLKTIFYHWAGSSNVFNVHVLACRPSTPGSPAFILPVHSRGQVITITNHHGQTLVSRTYIQLGGGAPLRMAMHSSSRRCIWHIIFLRMRSKCGVRDGSQSCGT